MFEQDRRGNAHLLQLESDAVVFAPSAVGAVASASRRKKFRVFGDCPFADEVW